MLFLIQHSNLIEFPRLLCVCGYGTNYYLLRAPSLLEVCVLLRKSGHFLQTFLNRSCVYILVVFNRSPYTWRNLTTERETETRDGAEKEMISIFPLAICSGPWLKLPLMETLHLRVASRALCPSCSVTGLSRGQGDRELMKDKCTGRLEVSVLHVCHYMKAGREMSRLYSSQMTRRATRERPVWKPALDTTLSLFDPGLQRKRHGLVLKSQTAEHCSATLCWQHCVKLLCASCLGKGARGQGEGSMRENRLEGNFVMNRN